MSATIQPTDWPNNMRSKGMAARANQELGRREAHRGLELGNLSMTEKAVAYRSVLIVGGIKHCRKHKRAEARMVILTLITYLSDNAKGTCFLSITILMVLLDRSRQ